MAERLDEIDAQDLAETFDEDLQDTDGRRRLYGDDELNPDEAPDVYDVTRAVGDEDDEDAMFAEDLDDDEIVALGQGEADDDEEEDDEDDDLDDVEGPLGDDDDEDEDDYETDADGGRGGGGHEVGLTYVGDVSELQGAHSAAQRYESRSLDDDDLEDLGYGASSEDGESDPAPEPAAPQSGRKTHEHEKTDRRLDEGVEETFPASDPVSVKHIS